ncbi:hypothetical protein PF005_g21389 [Phytophthora fragariae]|uniref:Uncharacterized protein n=1 Tax=Phytophthora fragariae TaxID=53985 RepID=A0A6A3YEP6_9STRA|nr:hypothetical protein PF003_g3034 [Phytophthora fragariae]KAE8933176.1 hypothetical protein PF009_g16812 [Phytophthora fragariae]KAE8991468.1 hypothetical protein PF011_g17935 [Phytophthora fragariae]KAE9099474.1 hypothetical protein PF007_g15863 [Phytophthora fragariae]KAE9099631.1 hypothetical protein PF010_g15126 [Phytophthora fragariae]
MCRTSDKGNSKSFAKTTENEQWQDVKRAAKPKRSWSNWRGPLWRSASASPLSVAVMLGKVAPVMMGNVAPVMMGKSGASYAGQKLRQSNVESSV